MAVRRWPRKMLWLWLFLLLGAPIGLAFLSKASFLEPPLAWRPVYEPGQGGATVSLAVSPHDPRRILSGGDMLGLALSEDAGDSWLQPSGLRGYEMADITFHPTDSNVVWTGSASGPYLSLDGGRTWEQRRDGLPPVRTHAYSAMVERITFDPVNHSRLLAVGGSSRRWNTCDTFGWIWESTDGGRKWSHLTTVFPDGSRSESAKGVNIVAIEFPAGRAGRAYLLAADVGVFTSSDAGRSWKRAESFPHRNVRRLAIHPSKPDTVWVCTGPEKVPGEDTFRPGGIFRSDDGGSTWTPLIGNLPQDRSAIERFTVGFDAFAVSAADPDVLWVCDHRWNQGIVYRSEDGGRTWKPVLTRLPRDATPPDSPLALAARLDAATFAGMSLTGLTAHPKDPLTVYGFGTEYLVRSRDGGITWTDITAYRPDADKPDHWRGRGWSGWCATNVAFNPYREGQAILQAMDAGRIWISDDGLRTFRYPARDPQPWLGGNDVSFARDGTIFATTGHFDQGNGILRSTDFGATFQTLAGSARGLPDAGGAPQAVSTGIYVHPDDSQSVWAVLNGQLIRSTDRGETWKPLADSPKACRWIAGDPTSPGRFYVSAADGIYVVTADTPPTAIGGPAPAGGGRINVTPKGIVLACQWRDGPTGVWKYDPSDKSWTRLLDEHYAYECVADPLDGNRLLLVTTDDPYHDHAVGSGVWVSHDGGKGWSSANRDLPVLRAAAVAFDPFDRSRVVIGTVGRGFFTARWPVSYKPTPTRTGSPPPSTAPGVP